MAENGSDSGRRVLGVFALAMINVAAIASLKNLALGSEYGLGMIFFYALAAAAFFVPVSLVAAELATGWPQTGGIYVWVREAFGPRWGFVAIWLQWVNNVFWFPTALLFIAGALAYVWNPALAKNKVFMLSTVLITFWVATLINFRGMRLSGIISSVGAIAGTLVPGGLIILMGIVWLATGNHSAAPLNLDAVIPDMTSIKQVVFAAGVILALAGMEMSAAHAQEVKDPQREYPKAILLSAAIIMVLYVLGSMAVAVVIPAGKISLVAGLMQAFEAIFTAEHIPWVVPLVAALTAFGAMASVSTWIVGPTKGIYAVALAGDLPRFFQKANRNAIPVNILLVQAGIVTAVSLVILFMPSVSASFWILSCVTAQIYLTMYLLMFFSAIRLRYTKPEVQRPYRIGRSNVAMWLVAGLGAVTSLACIAIGFFPPAQVKEGSLLFYESFLIVGIFVIGIGPPLLIFQFKRPEWKVSDQR